ncbi:MAG: dihydroorotate dehydrogenase electron transfer subunit [Pseudomonadota bacterium]
MNHPASRNTLFVEQAEVVFHDACPEGQFHMQLHAPETAMRAEPGHFIHMQCHPSLPMRRPMSLMRANKRKGSIDILYKVHGQGTGLLSTRNKGEVIDLIGPIGQPFKLDNYRKRPVLIGGGVGIPPMVFLAEHLKKNHKNIKPFVIMGSEIPFPFETRPSQIMMSELPPGIIACMPLLEDWGIASRLTSLQGYAGCFQGYVTDLARHWLDKLDDKTRYEVEIFTCGPTPMLKAVSELAKEYDLPCQVSMEEYMACAVGGCAGCTVLIETDDGPAMKRVCVDGPVFESSAVIQFQ